MIVRWSQRITSALLRRRIIDNKECEIYVYGFEILLSTLLNTFVIIVIAILTKTLLLSFSFVVFFGILRVFAGGYHASTHFRCLLLFCTTYFSLIWAVNMIPAQIRPTISMCAACLAFSIIRILAPVEDANKPLKEHERIKYRKISRMIISIQAAIIVFLTLLMLNCIAGLIWMEPLVLSMALGVFAAALSVAAGNMKNKGGSKGYVRQIH